MYYTQLSFDKYKFCVVESTNLLCLIFNSEPESLNVVFGSKLNNHLLQTVVQDCIEKCTKFDNDNRFGTISVVNFNSGTFKIWYCF